MQVVLMVPCYIDMFYPHVGIATLDFSPTRKLNMETTNA